MGNDIFDEEKPYLDVLGTLGSGKFPILLQQNYTLVVLVHNVLLNSIPLGLQAVLVKKCLWYSIILPDELVFSGTLNFYLLLF